MNSEDSKNNPNKVLPPPLPRKKKDDDSSQRGSFPRAQWFVSVNEERVGPLTEEEVRAKLESSEINNDSLIWCDGLSDWLPIKETRFRQDLTEPESDTKAHGNPGTQRKVSNSDLEAAVRKGIINKEQAAQLWNQSELPHPEQARFQALHVLYYFGGVLIFSSMSWFLTNVWSNGFAVMVLSGLFALLYTVVGKTLWYKHNLRIPGGLLITAAVGLAPVFIYGFQKATGLWPQESIGHYRDYHLWIKGSWFFMEIGTIIAALFALRYFRFTFITFPLAITLWYMSMDLTPLLFGKNYFTFNEMKTVSCIFGLFMIVGSYFVDKKYEDVDFAFWTYLCGAITFWGSLGFMTRDSELRRFLYFLMNFGFIGLAVYLRRRVFIVFGTLGIFGYISYLAWKLFYGSYLFPIVLALIGMFILFLGVKYQKNKAEFESFVEQCLPPGVMQWRPNERA